MDQQLGPQKELGTRYEAAFERASRRTLEHLESIQLDRDRAPDQLSELLAVHRDGRERVLTSTSRFHRYSLAAYMLARSEREILLNPGMAADLVRLARSVIGHIDPRACGGSDALSDLKAYALAVQGNNSRVCGDFPASAKAFAFARRVQLRGGVDPDLTATIDLLESSLRRDLRRLDWALALLDRSLEIFASLGDLERVSHVVVNQANVHFVSGHSDKAFAILGSALDWVSESRFNLAARHNMAQILLQAGRTREAEQVFSGASALYDRYADTLTTCRRLWLKGLIARELGDLEQASYSLESAIRGFMENGYPCDAGVAHFDLIATRNKRTARRRARRALA